MIKMSELSKSTFLSGKFSESLYCLSTSWMTSSTELAYTISRSLFAELLSSLLFFSFLFLKRTYIIYKLFFSSYTIFYKVIMMKRRKGKGSMGSGGREEREEGGGNENGREGNGSETGRIEEIEQGRKEEGE